MPSALTYPGVYIEEIPSGVRTITGVATSVTAFVGYTARGPVNRAVRIFNFGDYEREFGGLHRDSDVSYAVQQFFMNGGGDAYVVRVAAGANPAAVQMRWGAGAGEVALVATAVSPGAWGNNVRLDVDYETANPESTFNLTVTVLDPVTRNVVDTEQHAGLSMNSQSLFYAPTVVNGASRYIRLARPAMAFPAQRGFSLSRDVSAVNLQPGQTVIEGILDGDTPFRLTLLNPDAAASVADKVTLIGDAITAQNLAPRMTVVRTNRLGLEAGPAAQRNWIRIASTAATEFSSVAISPAAGNDAAAALGFGRSSGGYEFEGAAARRPVPAGTTSGDLSALAVAGTPVNGPVNVTISNPNAEVLAGPVAVAFDAFPPGPDLARELEESIRAQVNHPAARGATVRWVGRSLRVTLPAAYANATILLAGVAALDMPASGPTLNVQRYSLGVGPDVGGQLGAVPGTDGTVPGPALLRGSFGAKTGIYALRDVDLFNLLCIPSTATRPGAEDAAVGALVQEAVAFCEQERAFYIVDPPSSVVTRTDVETWAGGVIHRNAAVYYPRIRAADPMQNFRVREMPASGAIAGVFARTDAQRGVWKAPAGTEAALRGLTGLAAVLTDLENGPLNQAGINVLRTFPTYGTVVWGARTRRGADAQNDDYKYIPIRRLALYIEETLYRNTQWVVFEPNDEPLWSQIRLNIGSFMNGLFRQGAFQGNTPAKAYLVKCDAETTTQYDIDRGIVNILVAFAPLKPAEFVVIRIQQKAQTPA